MLMNRNYDYIIINAGFLHQSPVVWHDVGAKNPKGLK